MGSLVPVMITLDSYAAGLSRTQRYINSVYTIYMYINTVDL